MLWQLHHQFKDGHTEMMSQQEFSTVVDNEQFRKFVEKTQQSHPLPEGAIWLACNEGSEHFVWAKEDADG